MGTAMKKSLSKQIGAWFLGLLLLTVVVSTLWNYYSTRDAIIEVETENMEACAKMISGTLDNYGLEALRGDKGSDDYTMIRQSVRSISLSTAWSRRPVTARFCWRLRQTRKRTP